MDKLFIFGASGGAFEFLEANLFEGYDEVLCIVDSPSASDLYVNSTKGPQSYKIIAESEAKISFADSIFVSAFDFLYKKRIFTKYKDYNFPSFVHYFSDCLMPLPYKGVGIWIASNTHIASNATIENLVRVNYGAQITHDCLVRDFSFIGINVSLCAGARIGKSSFIASNSVILENISVGDHTLIGAGSVVTRDIPDNVIAYGNPCKIVRENSWYK
jgi:serine acetyltransferase